ncbi:AcrR family transcriptional regulator [Bacillus sp. SLBN-46]|jgi:AcrR family transcriptional regulator|uniref:TetR/AcrR family transcriptional regulator n=1 Tax=Bacillus sp. SLBN-46 TaxID=3042283 RepID=UPI00285582F5|nr:TetR/AcrR family transcriptional regulator [Bacillus sp. SLBN-46]MDR6125281.1 AcrR family transcriptional regulator [Bacillus sp. SLBN-46]
MRKISTEDRLLLRQSHIKKILKVIRTQGFLSLSIQEIAQLMNMSRASLYNYFSSKEDILMELNDFCISYIYEAGQMISNTELSYSQRLQKVFEHAVLSAAYSSEIFLKDLQISCMSLYEKKKQSRKEQMAAIHTFYQNGMEAGFFNEINPTLLIMQDETVLNKLINTSFLMDEELTLERALYDYFLAKCFQVLRPELVTNINHKEINCMVKDILHKLSPIL